MPVWSTQHESQKAKWRRGALHAPAGGCKPPLQALLVALYLATGAYAPARAGAEWGYEQAPESQNPGLSAPPAQSLITKPDSSSKAKTAPKQAKIAPAEGKASPAHSKSAATKPIDRQDQAVQYWLDLYTFVSPEELNAEQKSRLRSSLNSKLEGKGAEEVLGILDFWPRLKSVSAASPEQRDNYKSLLRSLLRLECRKGSGQNAEETEIISEILGPVRIAAAGCPSLTEEAIDAYADMACFLYEKNNPGKTVDALDNRAVFASVIRNKYTQAPSQKDREAMANFDLSWTKFKILWTGADERGREFLLSALVRKDATASGAGPKEPTLESVLHNGPWATLK